MKKNSNLSELINHLKSTGYIFPGSEIYGGIANTFDYGPLGSLLKNNLKNLWIKKFILEEDNNYLIDSAIFMNSKVWEASGHLQNFIDISIDCKDCKKRSRVDHLIENYFTKNNILEKVDYNNFDNVTKVINNYKIICPYCGKFHWSEPKKFNLILNTNLDLNENTNKVYLRPETAQGIFINFLNVSRSMRVKIPFGVGQIGKSFRNEVTPGYFIFRTKEFEQMELEIFCSPKDEDKFFKYYQDKIETFLTKDLEIIDQDIKLFVHPKEKLAHYSKKTIDFEYNFSFGWNELCGIANRGNYDLTQHSKFSNEKLQYLDPYTNEKYYPSVIEPSMGIDRLLLALLSNSYMIENIKEDNEIQRILLKLPYKLAPFLGCICPLSKQLDDKAKKIYQELLNFFSLTYDNTGSIGKRYRRQDAIGTPICITYDYESDNDKKVTIRNRDNMKQERINIINLKEYLFNFLK